MNQVSVRYFVRDMDAAVAFYRDLLGFEVELSPSPMFAMLYLGDFRLLLSTPGGGGGGSTAANGSTPEPGGWNRIAIKVDDIDTTSADLRSKGATFRGDMVAGVGVKQVVLEDPDGNPVELFQPLAAYHERASA